MSGWSSLAGYDPALTGALDARQRGDLELLSGGWCWAALGLSAPVVYTSLLLTRSAALSLAVGAGVLLLVMLLVRLTVAGGGRPLGAEAYRPSWTPLLWVALLGLLFALPAQLPLWHAAHAQRVADERAALLAMHQRVTGAATDDAYARELARCEFVVLRLHALAQEPAQTARYAFGYLALLLGPILLARLQASAALHAYDRAKGRQAQRLIDRDTASSERALRHLLASYRSPAETRP